MSELPSILVDGVSSVASHNGVHRITFFKLTNDPKPEPVLELQVPAVTVAELVNLLGRLEK